MSAVRTQIAKMRDDDLRKILRELDAIDTRTVFTTERWLGEIGERLVRIEKAVYLLLQARFEHEGVA